MHPLDFEGVCWAAGVFRGAFAFKLGVTYEWRRLVGASRPYDGA